MNYYLNFYNCTISHNNYPQIDRLKSKPFGVPGTSNVVVSVGRLFTETTMLLNVRKSF